MSNISNTPFYGNDLASNWHRVLGDSACCTDIDLQLLNENEVENTMHELNTTYDELTETRDIELAAIMDYKYPSGLPAANLSDSYFSIRWQIKHATKNNAPYFIVLYYLDPAKYEVPMYYVIPANEIAREVLPLELKYAGEWMTVKAFSKFQIKNLRKKTWNQNEVIRNENALLVGLRPNMTLRDLPDEPVKYPLPRMNFSWMTKEI